MIRNTKKFGDFLSVSEIYLDKLEEYLVGLLKSLSSADGRSIKSILVALEERPSRKIPFFLLLDVFTYRKTKRIFGKVSVLSGLCKEQCFGEQNFRCVELESCELLREIRDLKNWIYVAKRYVAFVLLVFAPVASLSYVYFRFYISSFEMVGESFSVKDRSFVKSIESKYWMPTKEMGNNQDATLAAFIFEQPDKHVLVEMIKEVCEYGCSEVQYDDLRYRVICDNLSVMNCDKYYEYDEYTGVDKISYEDFLSSVLAPKHFYTMFVKNKSMREIVLDDVTLKVEFLRATSCRYDFKGVASEKIEVVGDQFAHEGGPPIFNIETSATIEGALVYRSEMPEPFLYWSNDLKIRKTVDDSCFNSIPEPTPETLEEFDSDLASLVKKGEVSLSQALWIMKDQVNQHLPVYIDIIDPESKEYSRLVGYAMKNDFEFLEKTEREYLESFVGSFQYEGYNYLLHASSKPGGKSEVILSVARVLNDFSDFEAYSGVFPAALVDFQICYIDILGAQVVKTITPVKQDDIYIFDSRIVEFDILEYIRPSITVTGIEGLDPVLQTYFDKKVGLGHSVQNSSLVKEVKINVNIEKLKPGQSASFHISPNEIIASGAFLKLTTEMKPYFGGEYYLSFCFENKTIRRIPLTILGISYDYGIQLETHEMCSFSEEHFPPHTHSSFCDGYPKWNDPW